MDFQSMRYQHGQKCPYTTNTDKNVRVTQSRLRKAVLHVFIPDALIDKVDELPLVTGGRKLIDNVKNVRIR